MTASKGLTNTNPVLGKGVSGSAWVSAIALALMGAFPLYSLDAYGHLAQGRQIAYRSTDRPNEIGLYAYQHWVDPLPLMIQGALGQALREARAADEVSIPAFRLDRDYILYGRIVAFENVLEGATSRGQVEIEFSLVRQADEALLLQRTYREEIGASSQGMNDAVDALAIGLSRVIERLTSDLGKR